MTKKVLIMMLLLLYTGYTHALGHINDKNTSEYLPMVIKNSETILISLRLKEKLELEEETWHLRPYLRTKTHILDGILQEKTCLVAEPNSFPDGLFTDEQLKSGAFLFYALFGIYAFTLLANVCNEYFIPCVELICEDLKIPQNVAAATFMSVATSCPEFFVNVISTFLTESDMGIGTIVGSAIFNALGVAAIGGLAAVSPIAIDARPVTRDVIIYMINVSVLVAIVWDGQIDWYEAVVLGVLYVCYFVVMFNSTRLFALYDKMIGACCKKNHFEFPHSVSTEYAIADEGHDNKAFEDTNKVINGLPTTNEKVAVDIAVPKKDKLHNSVWRFPSEKSWAYKILWFYNWPLKFVLGLTIPSPIKHRRLYPLSFIMCIVWIGINSYFVSWSMTVIGNVFLIPDSVMGMTFLAFGGCLPEAFSIFIMSRRGEGGIGVSNALGANSLAILFALGLPWLIKTLTLLVEGAELAAVEIESDGIDFVVASLLIAVSCLWLTLYLGKFKLKKTVGFTLAILYAIFITLAILVEMGIILNVERLGKC